MPDDPPIPAPEELPKPAPKKAPRPPAPGWMWAVFGLGWVPVGALICGLSVASHPDQLAPAVSFGAVAGLVLGIPMIGGLALANRFFDDSAARFIGGIVFAVAITALVGGVAFAGCMCMLQGTNFH